MIMPPNQFNKNRKVNPKIGFEPAYTSSYQPPPPTRTPNPYWSGVEIITFNNEMMISRHCNILWYTHIPSNMQNNINSQFR